MTAAATPSVEQARRGYMHLVPEVWIKCPYGWECRPCGRFELRIDAASLTYDNAVAECHNAWSGPTQKQAGYVYP